ncbi:tyrosine--tRNA ligase, partial [bacterium]|nr:tyrosine--tRNA ligase [bacterium]
MNLFEEYKWRGTIHDATEQIEAVLAREKVTAYAGFDPTAASLHVGSLLPLMQLARLQKHGHSPIVLAGGGTGLVGDPSGKTAERQLLSYEQVEQNLIGIKPQLEQFLDFEVKTNPAKLVNNAEWLASITMMEFLREVGKNFTINMMLAKESVRRRYNAGDGISYAEFAYMLLQAYDYYVLNDRYNCTLEIGGSDQWGNITAGIDLISKKAGRLAHGIVFPLVTNASGTKFGKTEAGTVWLSADMTSPYRFYQWALNTDDRDVVNYLKYFTWLSKDEIHDLAQEVETAPEKRNAQRKLAQEITRTVHSEEAVISAEKASKVLFGGAIAGLSKREVMDIFEDIPTCAIERAK